MSEKEPKKPAATSALSPKQEAFCQEYLKDLNATKAAERAKYSKRSAGSQAHDLLKKPEIQARLQELMNARSERIQLDADYVLSSLQSVAERCMEKEPVMVRRGQEVVQKQDAEGRDVWKFDSSGANRALELLGKHLKLFIEKHEHSGPNGGPIPFDNLTDEQLDARLEEKLAKVTKGNKK